MASTILKTLLQPCSSGAITLLDLRKATFQRKKNLWPTGVEKHLSKYFALQNKKHYSQIGMQTVTLTWCSCT